MLLTCQARLLAGNGCKFGGFEGDRGARGGFATEERVPRTERRGSACGRGAARDVLSFSECPPASCPPASYPPCFVPPPCFAAVLASAIGGLAWTLRFDAARRLTKCALPWRMPLTAEVGLGNPCHDAETAGFCQKRAGLAIAESGRCRIPGMTMGLRKRFPRWRFVRINIARQYGLPNRLLFDHSGARRVLEPRDARAE